MSSSLFRPQCQGISPNRFGEGNVALEQRERFRCWFKGEDMSTWTD